MSASAAASTGSTGCSSPKDFGVGRRWAQRKAGTDDIQSPHYKRAFKEWMAPRPWAKDLDSPTRAHLFWCLDWRNDIDQWRETLAAQRTRQAQPPNRDEAALRGDPPRARSGKAVDPNAPKKETTRESLIRENEDLWAENAKLKRRVESRRRLPVRPAPRFDRVNRQRHRRQRAARQVPKPAALDDRKTRRAQSRRENQTGKGRMTRHP